MPIGVNAWCRSAIGLNKREVHEARELRDAEAAEPGIVRETLDSLLQEGEEPTKEALVRT